ncbi:hypothetical protein GCM10009789_77620 [Kribbella sancticallisti]|uniref:Activator of Hsp90 ATPase homologue 1/2-like C-terminal domain-containing protein n=1 Tax=Kribbella sancticallisti TaxID=460087 RepID=A0ABP4QIQ3_9ACTN
MPDPTGVRPSPPHHPGRWFGPTERAISRSGERRTVLLRRPYDATPAELWSAWTEPERIARWLGEITGDRVLGGEIRLTMTPQDIPVLRIEACEEPHRLVVTWSTPTEPNSQVELLLESEGDTTLLTLRHAVTGEERAAGLGYGWEDFLNRLHEFLAGRDPAAVSWSAAEEELLPLWKLL